MLVPKSSLRMRCRRKDGTKNICTWSSIQCPLHMHTLHTHNRGTHRRHIHCLCLSSRPLLQVQAVVLAGVAWCHHREYSPIMITGRVGRQLYWRRQLSTHLSPPSVVFETVDLIVHSLPVTPLAMNQYLLGCKRKKIAALIDCGCDRPERWIQAAAKVQTVFPFRCSNNVTNQFQM